MLDELRRLVAEGDRYAVLPLIVGASADDSREVAARFDSAVRELYWHAKDLRAVVVTAQAGIHYCLIKATEAMLPDINASDTADHLATSAKTLAANLASFTWPGWGEPTCIPSDADMAAGFDAARLNLRLAVELNKPQERVEAARWLLGAHQLAAGDPGAALEEFLLSNPDGRPLLLGYVQLARVLLGFDDAQVAFDELVGGLRTTDDKESLFSADQLVVAHSVFVKRTSVTSRG